MANPCPDGSLVPSEAEGPAASVLAAPRAAACSEAPLVAPDVSFGGGAVEATGAAGFADGAATGFSAGFSGAFAAAAGGAAAFGTAAGFISSWGGVVFSRRL